MCGEGGGGAERRSEGGRHKEEEKKGLLLDLFDALFLGKVLAGTKIWGWGVGGGGWGLEDYTNTTLSPLGWTLSHFTVSSTAADSVHKLSLFKSKVI